jgi:hypothetical protein
MLVKVPEAVRFPNYGWGWLSTRVVGPQNGRVLIEVRGHCGQDSWPEILLTAPEDAVRIEEEGKEIALLPGVYRIEEAQDKRGYRLLRFFAEKGDTDMVMFGTDGHLVLEASDARAVEVARARGHSRTGQNGDRFAIIAAPVGAVVAVQPFERRRGDPVYLRVEATGVVPLGESDAVLHPTEW